MRRLLGVLLIFAGVAGGIAWLVTGLVGLEIRMGETRTPLPGERTMSLQSGKHVVYYEAAATSSGDDDIDVPAVEVRLHPPDGDPLPLGDYFGSFEVSGTNGRTARAIATVRVPEAGRYLLRVDGGGLHPQEAVVLGRPIAGKVMRTIAIGLGLIFGGVAVGLLVIFIGRRRRATHSASGLPTG